METEIWRPVKDWDWYEVSNLGRVKRLKTNHILKPIEDVWGYLNVNLYGENSKRGITNGRLYKRPKKRKIHQLVAEVFCDGYEEGFVPDHIDRNRKIDNYNEPVIFTTKSGEKKQFGSIVEASKETGLDVHSISSNILGRRKDFKIGHFELLHQDTLQTSLTI